MNARILCNLFCLLAFAGLAQELKPFLEMGKWGFKNEKGLVVIPNKYDSTAGSFYEGFMAVQQNQKWGFINSSGKEITSFKYTLVEPFSDSVAIVNIGAKMNYNAEYSGGKWGLINGSGNEVISTQFDELTYNAERDLVIVSNGGTRQLDDRSEVYIEGKWGLFDKAGKLLIPLEYDYIDYNVTQVSLGGKWIVVRDTVEESNLDDLGNEIISKLVSLPRPRYSNGKYGLIDWKGKLITPIKYNGVKELNEKLFAVNIGGIKNLYGDYVSGGKWALVNNEGKEITTFTYSEIGILSENILMAGKGTGGYNEYGYSDRKLGYIDISGIEITDFIYDEASDFHEGFAIVNKNGKAGFINQKGRQIIPCYYDFISAFSAQYAVATLNSKFGIIDTSGKVIIPIKYSMLHNISEGLAGAQLNGKFGFLNTDNKLVIPYKYDMVGSFSQGLAPIEVKKKWGFVDKTGKEVIIPQYDHVSPFEMNKTTTYVSLNNETFNIDKTGKRIKEN